MRTAAKDASFILGFFLLGFLLAQVCPLWVAMLVAAGCAFVTGLFVRWP